MYKVIFININTTLIFQYRDNRWLVSSLLKIPNEDNVFKSLGILFQYFEARQVFSPLCLAYIMGTGMSVMRVDFTKAPFIATQLNSTQLDVASADA